MKKIMVALLSMSMIVGSCWTAFGADPTTWPTPTTVPDGTHTNNLKTTITNTPSYSIDIVWDDVEFKGVAKWNSDTNTNNLVWDETGCKNSVNVDITNDSNVDINVTYSNLTTFSNNNAEDGPIGTIENFSIKYDCGGSIGSNTSSAVTIPVSYDAGNKSTKTTILTISEGTLESQEDTFVGYIPVTITIS